MLNVNKEENKLFSFGDRNMNLLFYSKLERKIIDLKSLFSLNSYVTTITKFIKLKTTKHFDKESQAFKISSVKRKKERT